MAYVYKGTTPAPKVEERTQPAYVFDASKCGQYKGYKQHQNHGIPACLDCKRANSEHVKAFNARKRLAA